MAVEEEKEVEDEYGDTPAGRLTQSLLMQTASHRATTNRRRPDSREYRSASVPLTLSSDSFCMFELLRLKLLKRLVVQKIRYV